MICLFFFSLNGLVKVSNYTLNLDFSICLKLFSSFVLQYYQEMMESGIFVRDFGTKLEEIDLSNSGITMGYTFY